MSSVALAALTLRMADERLGVQASRVHGSLQGVKGRAVGMCPEQEAQGLGQGVSG